MDICQALCLSCMFCGCSWQVLTCAVHMRGSSQPPAHDLRQHRDNAMQGRALPAEQVLPMLRKQAGELCCQYLEYLVVGRGSQVPEHHTELALSFASTALALMPPVDERCERLCFCCTAAASTEHQQAALMKCQWDCSGTSTVHLSPGERSESGDRPAFVLSVSQ